MDFEMLVLFVSLQLLLVLLDVWELHRRRQDSGAQEPWRWRTLLFLLGVTGLFLCLQLGGGWLTPQPMEILESAGHRASAWTGAPADRTLPGAVAVLLGAVLFYIAGLWDYLVHRYFSHSRWFWITHEYHHLPRQVTILMPGILVRPFGFIPVTISTLATAVTIYVLLCLFTLPLWDLRPLLPALLVIGLVLTASHSCFLRRCPRVHEVMRCALLTTPQEHLLHHGVASHCNYGNFTTLWDRLFGSYRDPKNVVLSDVRLGLSYDQDFLGTLTMGALRLSSETRRRYQIARYCNLEDPPDI